MWWSEYYVLLFSLALVTVVDGCGRDEPPVNRPPSITCPHIGDVTAPASRTSAIVTWGQPSASDDRNDYSTSQTSGKPSGSWFSEGSHAVTYQAVDGEGLKDFCIREFTVRVIRCSHLIFLRNGHINCTHGTIYGSTCNFLCDSGYYLDGVASLTCQSNGQYQDSPPTCQSQGAK